MNRRHEPHVLIAPAMGVPARYYRALEDAFAQHDWSATTVPRRGLDTDTRPPSRRHDWAYADESADLVAAVKRCRADDPTRPVIVLGHSLGAQLCAHIAVVADEASQPDGFVTVAGSLPWHRHYPRGGVAEYAVAAAVPIVTAIVGYWPTPGFGAPTPRTLMREWARMVRTGRLPFGARGKPGTVPTLAVRLDADVLVPPGAAAALEECFADDSRTVWTYTEKDCPPGGSRHHLRWVRTPDVVVDHICDWWTRGAGGAHRAPKHVGEGGDDTENGQAHHRGVDRQSRVAAARGVPPAR